MEATQGGTTVMQHAMVNQIGPYKLIERIGGGSFSDVFLVQDQRTREYGERAVIKRVRPGLLRRDPVFLESLLNEAELGMMVKDPHVVQVNGVVDETEPAVVMEYVEGFDLDAIIRAHEDRGIPVEIAADIARQVCEGLEAIHSVADAGGHPLELVYQDLKPSNIRVTPQGIVKILDLGLVRSRRNAGSGLWVRRGTPGYRAPEQSLGGYELSPSSDLYALGVILMEMLQGRPLFSPSLTGGKLLERQQHVSAGMGVLASRVAPPGLDTILQRLLAFEPRERPSRALDVAQELGRWQVSWKQPVDLPSFLEKIAPRIETAPHRSSELDDLHSRPTDPGLGESETPSPHFTHPAVSTLQGLNVSMSAVRIRSFRARSGSHGP